jgi:glucose-6-phosphate 1-dehydrogenase
MNNSHWLWSQQLPNERTVGDSTLFAGQEGVEAAWAVVQPALRKVVPV